MEKSAIKIKDLPTGCIIWRGYTILGITGATLPKEFYEKECVEVIGNENDYELIKGGKK